MFGIMPQFYFCFCSEKVIHVAISSLSRRWVSSLCWFLFSATLCDSKLILYLYSFFSSFEHLSFLDRCPQIFHIGKLKWMLNVIFGFGPGLWGSILHHRLTPPLTHSYLYLLPFDSVCVCMHVSVISVCVILVLLFSPLFVCFLL